MTPTTRKNVHLTEETLAQIGQRGSLSGRIAMIVDRYAQLCARNSPTLKFTPYELKEIEDACCDIRVDPAENIPGAIISEVEADMMRRLGYVRAKHHHDLLSKLNTLTLGEEIALVEWLEERWSTRER